MPLRALGVHPGDVVAFVVTVERVTGPQRVVVERHPNREPIRIAVPSATYAAEHWRA